MKDFSLSAMRSITTSLKLLILILVHLQVSSPTTEAADGVRDNQIGHRLRVGMLQVSDKQRLVVLGISNGAAVTADLDFDSLGFKGHDLKHLDPRFLFEVNKGGIQRVRLFEKASISTGADGGLPPTLIETQSVKSDLLKHLTRRFFFFLKSYFRSLLALPKSHDQDENLNQVYAYYLLEILYQAFDPANPLGELKAAMSDDPEEAEYYLKRLGEALLMRFNPKSNFRGLIAPSDKRGELFENWINFQKMERISRKGRFIQDLNSKNQRFVSFGHDFGFIVDGTRLTQLVSFGFCPSATTIINYRSAKSGSDRPEDCMQAFGSILALTELDLPAQRPNSQSESLPISLDVLPEQIRVVLQKQHLPFADNGVTGKASKVAYLEGLKKEIQQRTEADRSHSSKPTFDPWRTVLEYKEKLFPKQVKASGPKPVILLMVDGLRPDRFKQAVEAGYLPNLKSIFHDRGVNVKMFASQSLTLPSWTTILTGYEPDTHGIKSNTPISVDEQMEIIDFLDPKDDILYSKNRIRNRAFQRLQESGLSDEEKLWFPGYFGAEQKTLNFLPTVSGGTYPFWDFITRFVSKYPEYTNDAEFLATILDQSSAKQTTDLVKKDHGANLRLIVNWYASVDEASHRNNHLLPVVYRKLDKSIGKLLNAARKHPYLKNANVILISDHGHSGGFDSNDKNPALLLNTGFNISRFLADTYTKSQFWVDYVGNSVAHVYVKPLTSNSVSNSENGSSRRRRSFRELEEISKTLLKTRVMNLMVNDPSLVQKVSQNSRNHPVEFFAMALPGKAAKDSSYRLFGGQGIGDGNGKPPSLREPVLVRSLGETESDADTRTALILTQSDSEGNDSFRYVVLKNFSQDENGEIAGSISDSPKDDPLQYLQYIDLPAEVLRHWRTDREWLNLAQDHAKPTAVFALVRELTLAPRYTDPSETGVTETVKKKRQSEIPDFLVAAHYGFGFRSDAKPDFESDHGGFSSDEVQNSFYIGSLHPEWTPKTTIVWSPFLTRDVMPTLLELAVSTGGDGPATARVNKENANNSNSAYAYRGGISFLPLINAEPKNPAKP